MRDIWVDFNGVDTTTNWVTSMLEFAENPESILTGSSVLAGDDDGNTAKALVIDVNHAKGLVTLSMDMGSFHAAEVDEAAYQTC